MFAIIQDIIFPLMSYSQADEELWQSDPREYIRVKFGIIYISVNAFVFRTVCMN